MREKKPQIIIVKKVKKSHGGHHGGSWKVAYADFVTAMMAFFMVLWIMGMDNDVKAAIEAYFSNPVGLHKGYSTGSSPLSTGASPGINRVTPIKLITRQHEMAQFRELAKQIEESLRGEDALGALAAQVEVIVTDQGLRIELVEGGDGEMFFAFGSAQLKSGAARVLRLIADDLRSSAAPIVVEGHTDAARFGTSRYTNWELSADRANAARRVLEESGLDPVRLREIRGHADRDLRNGSDPLDPSNRRISVLLPFTSAPAVVEERGELPEKPELPRLPGRP